MVATTVKIACTLVLWAAGAAWVLIPHRWEGRVVMVLSSSHGIHSHDIIGVIIPLLVTVAIWIPKRPRDV